MKKYFFVLGLAMLGFSSQAQKNLANTKWSGSIAAPSPIDVEFTFSKDTFNIIYNGESLEEMTYTLKGDTMSVKKIAGRSPCVGDDVATYKVEMTEEKLVFTPLVEPCEMRAAAFDGNGYTRVKP